MTNVFLFYYKCLEDPHTQRCAQVFYHTKLSLCVPEYTVFLKISCPPPLIPHDNVAYLKFPSAVQGKHLKYTQCETLPQTATKLVLKNTLITYVSWIYLL